MPDIFMPFSDLYQLQIDASRRISDALFSGTGKIDRTVLNAAHGALDDQLHRAASVGKMRDLRDIQRLSEMQSRVWSQGPSRLQQVQQELMRILAEMQNEVGRASQTMTQQLRANLMENMPFTPPGARSTLPRSATDPMGGLMQAWESAMRGMTQFSDDVLTAAQQTAQAVDPFRYRQAPPGGQKTTSTRAGTSVETDLQSNGRQEFFAAANGGRAAGHREPFWQQGQNLATGRQAEVGDVQAVLQEHEPVEQGGRDGRDGQDENDGQGEVKPRGRSVKKGASTPRVTRSRRSASS